MVNCYLDIGNIINEKLEKKKCLIPEEESTVSTRGVLAKSKNKAFNFLMVVQQLRPFLLYSRLRHQTATFASN
jgi:hypothetical protein